MWLGTLRIIEGRINRVMDKRGEGAVRDLIRGKREISLVNNFTNNILTLLLLNSLTMRTAYTCNG